MYIYIYIYCTLEPAARLTLCLPKKRLDWPLTLLTWLLCMILLIILKVVREYYIPRSS